MSGVWKGGVMNCASAFRHNFSLPQNNDIGIDCPLNFLDMHGARGRRRPEYCERLGSGATATEQCCVVRCERTGAYLPIHRWRCSATGSFGRHGDKLGIYVVTTRVSKTVLI